MFGGSASVRTVQTVLSAEDRATAKLDSAEAAGDRAAESMGGVEQRLNSVTQMMAVTGAATAALGGSILALNARFGRLDEPFATIQETSGATSEEMEQIREAAKGVATDLPVALSQSAEAAKQLSFAGLSATETMAALNETSQLAVASNLQAGEAAQTVARSLNAFELEARQTDAVVGALGQTFASSATNIRSLSQGLSEVQATANAAGVSVAETTATLGLLASSGLDGSKSGTALNATLRKLTSGSGQTKEALDELGLSMQDFTDESGNLRDLPVIMRTLSGEMNQVESQAERLRIANELVGAEGARALLPMIQNTDELSRKVNQNLRAEIQGAIGDLSQMDGQELEQVSNALGTDVSGETTGTELIANLQQLAEEGDNTEQIASRLQVGLGLTGDAAELLAQDITETNKSAEELASTLDATTTAEDLAQAQTRELSGQITQLRSDLQVIGYEMQQGTKPALSAVVGGMRSLTTPIAENERLAKAFGAGLVGLTGVAGVATVALGAHAAQLKLTMLAHGGLASQTYAGSAALWAHSAATAAASKAQWLMTASAGELAFAIGAKTGVLAGEATALWASTTAALSNATAMGIMTGAVGLATTAVTALWTALGPIGLLALGVTGAIIGLAGVMKFDLFGAGEQAGNILGWFGEKAGVAWRATQELVGILYELGRIGVTIAGLSLLAPFAGVLKLPGLIADVGPEVKAAAMQLPHQVIAGLDSLGPAKYALPVLGPLLAVRDMLTNPDEWRESGAQIPSMIAAGIGDAADAPVDAVTGVVGDVRSRLPFSPAKEGPLQDIDKTGPALVSTIADGVESESGQLTSALEATLGRTPLGMAAGAAADVAGDAAGSVGGQKIEVTVNNETVVDGSGDVGSDVETAAQRGTSSGLDEFLRRLSREVNGRPGGQQ